MTLAAYLEALQNGRPVKAAWITNPDLEVELGKLAERRAACSFCGTADEQLVQAQAPGVAICGPCAEAAVELCRR